MQGLKTGFPLMSFYLYILLFPAMYQFNGLEQEANEYLLLSCSILLLQALLSNRPGE